jgi:hypothetical protein
VREREGERSVLVPKIGNEGGRGMKKRLLRMSAVMAGDKGWGSEKG